MRTNKIITVLSVLFILLAVTRLILHDKIAERMDMTFFALLALAFLLHVVPFERLKSFKAAGIELSLELPQVQGAIAGLGLDRIQDEKLRRKLSYLQNELETIPRSRVLWIDDKPGNVIGERRLLRALGVEVVSAVSSETAEQILNTDNDFDLIITDVQRKGDSYKLTGGVDIHEGVNFIIKLRTNHPDPITRTMPVMFYAAYDWNRLIKFTRPASKSLPEPEVSNTVADFITKVVKQLADARSSPITYKEEKAPTPVG